MFHCRPSELESEDGLFLLQLLDVKHWRDAAAHYDEDPHTGMVSNEDKKRFVFLSAGVNEALYMPVEELTEDLLKNAEQERWQPGKAKKEEIHQMMAELNSMVAKED